jgi:hypothetical protein
MGCQTSIDIDLYKACIPKDVVKALINSGWVVDLNGKVSYLLPDDNDSYD